MDGESCLKTVCSAEDFLGSVHVWIERPQVINKRLVGAVLKDSDGGLVRQLLPKAKGILPTNESIKIEREKHAVIFTSASGVYRLEWRGAQPSHEVLLTISGGWHGDGVTMPTADWLSEVLLPKIVHWAENNSAHLTLSKPHQLVALDKFYHLYSLLKDKHGSTLVKNWPETTDPYKFVYEDIAIAAYLLVLWEEERKELNLTHKQSFIDLGCGNGLLVYLLSAEGHPGKGIDLRSRKIWKMFGDKAVLEVCVLTPSDKTLFPDCNWLIGNHSDELTPWIPVMAARSSYSARYFVLPCCPHDFKGKYCRADAHTSQYRSYLNYVRVIGEEMGFTVDEDVLRIPSSKRVCQVGRARTYLQRDEESFELKRLVFLQQRCVNLKPEQWASGFHPRPVNEHVRNCSQISFSTISQVIDTVAAKLLESECWITVQQPGDKQSEACSGSQWNHGGKLSLCQVVGLFQPSILRELKQEYGGMQTLLRNQHQVFSVFSGSVELRDWSQEQPSSSSATQRHTQQTERLVKTKLCWFHSSHPQGCPRAANRCPYAHGCSELRARPDFKHVLQGSFV